jgi:hypothetical protein
MPTTRWLLNKKVEGKPADIYLKGKPIDLPPFNLVSHSFKLD